MIHLYAIGHRGDHHLSIVSWLKLENRYKSKHPNSLVKPCTYNDPVEKIPPSGNPSWMIVPEHSNESAASSDLDLFCDVEPTNSD